MIALQSHFSMMATHPLTSMKRIKLYDRHSTWNFLLSCRCFIEPLRTPGCAASGCRLNRFYCGSCMLIQCGNCWHNCRKRSRHVVIVLRAALCLSDSQCRLSDCLGHCRNSLASERRCETEWCWLFPRSLHHACAFSRVMSALLCRTLLQMPVMPHLASSQAEKLGLTSGTVPPHIQILLLNLRQYGSIVKGCCITSVTYYIVHYKCLKLSWVCVRLLFIKLSLRTQQP